MRLFKKGLIISIIVAVCVCGWIAYDRYISLNHSSSRKKVSLVTGWHPEEERSYSAAYTAARQYLKKRLKNPDTARWEPWPEARNRMVYMGNWKYSIRSWVESKNSFGESVHQKFIMAIQKNKDGRWESDYLALVDTFD